MINKQVKAMSLFTKAISSTEKVDLDKIKQLAENFNKLIAKYPASDYHYINSGLDMDTFVYLNTSEIEMISKEALGDGWEFKSRNDNYQTISYSLSKIK